MNLYDQLILIAPAHINGLIQENLSQQVRKFVMSHIHKDYMHLNEKEILSSIQVEVTKLKRLAP